VVLLAAVSRGGAWQRTGCAAYALTLVALHGASTLSHLFRRANLRHRFRVADQALIYLFIAGSYTPISFTWLRDGPWWALHALMWGVALAGFVSKVFFAHRVRLGSVSAGLYLLLGWMPAVAAWPIAAALPGGLVGWLVAGGLCYTAGIGFFRYDRRFRYFHAAWHVLVLAGGACHYFGVLIYCTEAAARG
jgi:hemolysin III